MRKLPQGLHGHYGKCWQDPSPCRLWRMNRTAKRSARPFFSGRSSSQILLLDLIESGAIKHKNNVREWVFRHDAGRSDSLLCTAAALEDRLIAADRRAVPRFPASCPDAAGIDGSRFR